MRFIYLSRQALSPILDWTKFVWLRSRRLTILVPLVVFISNSVLAQTSSFQFLQIPGNATLSALGGINVSSTNQNVNFFQSNPALPSDTTNGWGSASYLFYFADIGMANFSYQHNFNRVGALSFGVQHLSLGSVEGYDASGVAIGNFESGETAIYVGKSHTINNFKLGANLKGVVSNIAGYRANALLFDLGGVFVHPHQDLNVGLVIKNFGFLLSEYSETSSTKFPFDIQAGVSFKPQHMPIRFSFTAHHLTSFDIPYDHSELESEELTSLNKALAHLSLGAEVLVHKNARLLLGYNFLKYQELKLETAGRGSGFSFGVLARVKNMEISVSRTGYVTGGSYQVSISADLKKIITSR